MRDRDRDRDWSAYRMGAVVPPVDSLAELNALLATYTLDLNPAVENITKDGSDLVAQWDETGTVGGAYVQANADNKPQWLADGGNGRPAVRMKPFNEPSYSLLARSVQVSYNTYFATAAAFAVIVIEWAGTTVLSGTLVLRLAGDTSGRLGLRGTALNKIAARHFDTADDSVTWSGTLAATTRYIIAIRHAGGQVGISVNGGAWEEAASGDTGTPTTAANWFIGDGGGGTDKKIWRIAGTTAYPGDAEYAALVALLASVYGVTV